MEDLDDADKSEEHYKKLIPLLEVEREGNSVVESIYAQRGMISKHSQWIIGGDGWAYDIGFGGLDHVLSMGEDVNIVVLDTEIR